MGMARDMIVDMRDVDRLERDLKFFAKRAFPFATKAHVNSAAFDARSNWREEIGDEFVERNKFTRNSIRVQTAKGLNPSTQEAVVGSIAPYMDDQEFGGVKRKKGKKGVDLTTSYASGEGRGAKPRTRLARAANAMKNINLRKRRTKAKGRAQRNLAVVRAASESSNKHVYLDTGRKQGIYRIVGKGANAEPQMVHDLTEDSVLIKSKPTMRPAVDKTTRRLPEIYRDAILFQLRRLGIFKER